MPHFALKIETGNAAFQDTAILGEIELILLQLARRIHLHEKAKIYDSNGNVVGWYEFTDKDFV